MPTEEKKDRADKIRAYMFGAGVAICLLAFVVMAVTGKIQPAVRVLVVAFWLVFATWNGVTFYTGRITWKSGPTFTREESPTMFYASAIVFALGSMSMASFLVWAAYFAK